jgi:uncharacterized protein with NRDE domain
MCLIIFAYRFHPVYSLILISNRDEFLDRPSERLHWWDESPILAGRDLRSGGTWLGISRNKRWAAVTNYRETSRKENSSLSRGHLVCEFLTSGMTPPDFARSLESKQPLYSGYNLLLGAPDSLLFCSNRTIGSKFIVPGIYGLSNHLFDNDRPKIVEGKKALNAVIKKRDLSREDLFSLLLRKNAAPDRMLVDKSLPIEWERALSAAFVELPEYGTRVSTVVLQEYSGALYIEERSHHPKGESISYEM